MPTEVSQTTVYGLESTLSEIEPIIRGTEGAFQFTDPSFQEILTAKQFADEINSGELSVRDAYVNYWSYVEDADLWDLPRDREWRALLPSWKNLLLHLIHMLDSLSANKMIEEVSRSFSRTNHILKNMDYNPFYEDGCFCCVVAGRNAPSERVVNRLIKETGVYLDPKYSWERNNIALAALYNINHINLIPFLLQKIRKNIIPEPNLEDIADAACKINIIASYDLLLYLLEHHTTDGPDPYEEGVRLGSKVLFYLGLLGQQKNNPIAQAHIITEYAVSELIERVRLLEPIFLHERTIEEEESFSAKKHLAFIASEKELFFLSQLGTYEAVKFLVSFCVENEIDSAIKLLIEETATKELAHRILSELSLEIEKKYFILFHKANNRPITDPVEEYSMAFEQETRSKKRTYDLNKIYDKLACDITDVSDEEFKYIQENGDIKFLKKLFQLRKLQNRRLFPEKIVQGFYQEFEQRCYWDSSHFQGKEYKEMKKVNAHLLNTNLRELITNREMTYEKIEAIIQAIHQKLKPQGYNPPVKRLTA